jgi:hypothetical protein
MSLTSLYVFISVEFIFYGKNVNANFLPVVIMMQFNCFSLNSIGPMVEMLTGPRRFIAVYFSSALAGACS